METTIKINGKDVKIELTPEQVKAIKRASINPMEFDTYKAVCEAIGIDPLTSLPFPDPETKKEVFVNGAFKMATIYEAFNGEWEPDFTNKTQAKRFPWHEFNPSLGRFVYAGTDCAYTFTLLGARLCTDTEEKDKYIAKTFNKEWNEFLNPQI